MAFTRPALNPQQSIIDTDKASLGLPSFQFLIFMRGLIGDVQAAPTGFPPVTEQVTAAIPTTAIPTDGDLSAGLYRVSWIGEVLTAAGVSSDFQVTISWTSNGVSKQKVGALTNGNTTATYEANSVPLLYADAATPITFAVAYNSNPANAMVLRLSLTLERLAAL